MATSEYIRNGSTANKVHHSVSHLPAATRSASIGPATATAAVLALNDLLMMALAFGAALVLRTMVVYRFYPVLSKAHTYWIHSVELAYLGWFMLAFILVARRYGLYAPIAGSTAGHELRLVVQACLNAGLLLCGTLYLFRAVEVSRILVMLLVASSAVTLSVRRAIGRLARYRQFAQGIELRNVVILGTNQLSLALSRHLQQHIRLGYRFVGFVSATGATLSPEIVPDQVLGGVDKIRQLTRLHFVDEVVIGEFCPTEQAIRLLEDARELGIDVRAIAGYYGELTANAPVEYLGIFPMSALHRSEPRVVGLFFKRIVDIVLSLGALIAAAPLMTAIALAVKLDSPGPVFYVSERIGKRGRVFRCVKYRTMVRNAEAMKKDLAAQNERDEILFKMRNDPRITRLGRFLRKYSLDELPQFLNVLRGEMSIVGPRPPIASEVEKYELEHFRRLEVMPGLTGLWQVQARHDPSFARYIELDTAYVENWSLWLDLKILARTADVVLRGTGS
ncbi:MAG TPA: sugar transferase [Acidobacteriaceae bacterium]|nr:sugar transferase [Acidobacteriaceae bacterium]